MFLKYVYVFKLCMCIPGKFMQVSMQVDDTTASCMQI